MTCGLEPLQSPCVRRVGIGFFQICLQTSFQSLLAVFQRNFSIENVTTHTKAMTDMIINSGKSVPSWTSYCGKLVSLLINRTEY